MDGFRDGNVQGFLQSRFIGVRHGHQGCVNTISWNSMGSLLISGSDDTRINVWSYTGQKLLHSIETGHSTYIFCAKFIPEISDEFLASGASDAGARLFNLSCLSGRVADGNTISLSALFQCHTRRFKKLAVEVGNPNVVWSASEDGTLRQHYLREGYFPPPAGSSRQECRNVLVAQEIELEAKFQNDKFNQLPMTLIKAQAGVKNDVRRLNKSIVQYGLSNVIHGVAFALVCFFIVNMWFKTS